jgi:hypothetical protein
MHEGRRRWKQIDWLFNRHCGQRVMPLFGPSRSPARLSNSSLASGPWEGLAIRRDRSFQVPAEAALYSSRCLGLDSALPIRDERSPS